MCFQVSGSCMDYVSPGGRINNVCSSTCLCLKGNDHHATVMKLEEWYL